MKRLVKKKGLFVTFEGIEGSGKTTQIKALSEWFQKKKISCLLTREPGGTPLADRIRALLLHAETEKITPEMELLLYEVARRDHIKTIIEPALRKGRIVLCDRFADSTTAYQGYARGMPLSTIEAMNQIASDGLIPDLTFLFDLPVTEGLRRVRERKKGLDRLEREALSFHEKVRKGYLTLARKEKRRFKIIDARESPTKIFARLCHEVEKLL